MNVDINPILFCNPCVLSINREVDAIGHAKYWCSCQHNDHFVLSSEKTKENNYSKMNTRRTQMMDASFIKNRSAALVARSSLAHCPNNYATKTPADIDAEYDRPTMSGEDVRRTSGNKNNSTMYWIVGLAGAGLMTYYYQIGRASCRERVL